MTEPGLISAVLEDAKSYCGIDRRREARFALGVGLNVVPINEVFETTGNAFVAVTRDISASGIVFYHTAPLGDKLLAIEFRTPRTLGRVAVVQVLRCREMGPFFEISGRFIA